MFPSESVVLGELEDEVHQRYSQLRPLHHLLKVLSSKEEPALEFLWSPFTIVEDPELIQQEEEPLDPRDGNTVIVRGIMEKLKLQNSFAPAQTRIRGFLFHISI